jgi:hypothetical protein
MVSKNAASELVLHPERCMTKEDWFTRIFVEMHAAATDESLSLPDRREILMRVEDYCQRLISEIEFLFGMERIEGRDNRPRSKP